MQNIILLWSKVGQPNIKYGELFKHHNKECRHTLVWNTRYFWFTEFPLVLKHSVIIWRVDGLWIRPLCLSSLHVWNTDSLQHMTDVSLITDLHGTLCLHGESWGGVVQRQGSWSCALPKLKLQVYGSVDNTHCVMWCVTYNNYAPGVYSTWIIIVCSLTSGCLDVRGLLDAGITKIGLGTGSIIWDII